MADQETKTETTATAPAAAAESPTATTAPARGSGVDDLGIDHSRGQVVRGTVADGGVFAEIARSGSAPKGRGLGTSLAERWEEVAPSRGGTPMGPRNPSGTGTGKSPGSVIKKS